jgi:hypothetical protein
MSDQIPSKIQNLGSMRSAGGHQVVTTRYNCKKYAKYRIQNNVNKILRISVNGHQLFMTICMAKYS